MPAMPSSFMVSGLSSTGADSVRGSSPLSSPAWTTPYPRPMSGRLVSSGMLPLRSASEVETVVSRAK